MLDEQRNLLLQQRKNQDANPVNDDDKNIKDKNKGGGKGKDKDTTQVVPDETKIGDEFNVADYASELVVDPSSALTGNDKKTKHVNENMRLANRVKGDANITKNEAQSGLIDDQAPMDFDALNQNASQAQASQANGVDPRQAISYNAAKTQQNIAQNGQATAKQGQVSDGSVINESEVPQINIDEIASGQNELGQALLDYAEQDLNAVDPQATVKGQLEQLQADFTGPNGEPVIPNWAQGTARAVSKIAAFKGMTGSAATAAMSQALMEASLPVAQADAQFFQTLTLENLSNKQQSIINRANVLSKFEEMNQDSRTAAAIQNAKHFMEMDLANLNNRQQTEIINTQARVQSILEDAKAENTARLFEAQSQNDMNMFYDQLNSQIEMYNTTQTNQMKQFNTSEVNAMRKFNAELENQREQYYRDMAYNIDVANAKWRQTVTLTNAEMKFEAAAFDTKNLIDISTEQLNQLWDRSDALLDYIWKSSENELDRKNRLALTKLQGDIQSRSDTIEGLGSLFGTVLGSASENFFAGEGIFKGLLG